MTSEPSVIARIAARLMTVMVWLLWSSAAAFAVDVAVAGKVAIVSGGKLAKVIAKQQQQPAQSAFPLPAPGSAEDPTVAGAAVDLFDAVSPGAGFASFTLDASGWSGLGNPAGSLGYRYLRTNDLTHPNGGCRTVLLTEKLISITCKGSAVTLVPPFSGDLQVVLRIADGSPSRRYCASFGGDTRRNDATSFKSKDAAAPAGCPLVEPTPTPTVTPCSAGLAFGGACWFTGGQLGQSCDQVCAGEGLTYDEATRTVAGSDGADADCLALLNLFGFPSQWIGGVECFEVGGGCSSMPIEFVSGRCISPPTTADANQPSVARICACQ
jgi:hypothetical protein